LKITLCFTLLTVVIFSQIQSNDAQKMKRTIQCRIPIKTCDNIISSSTYSDGCNNCYCQEGASGSICTAMACQSMESDSEEDKKFCDNVRRKVQKTKVVYKSCQDPKTTCSGRAIGEIFTQICQRCTCKGNGNEPVCESAVFRFGKKCVTHKSTLKAMARFCQKAPKFEPPVISKTEAE